MSELDCVRVCDGECEGVWMGEWEDVRVCDMKGSSPSSADH